MMTNSLMQQSLRRLAARNRTIFRPSSASGVVRISAPAAGNYISYRPATTQTSKVDSSAASSILVAQRLNRPVSPNLGIYRPQITWYLSSLNRITGAVLSGSFYTFGFLYLISPLFGWQLGSAALAAGFAKWPVVAKAGLKFLAAFPFTFHGFNGLRHLVWDMGLQLKNQQVINTGWTVVGLSAAATLGLVLI